MKNEMKIRGRLGKDPVFKDLGEGKAVCTLSVVTQKKKGTKEFTTWHTVVVFDDLAKICHQILKKNMIICAEGEMSSRNYTPKDTNFTITKYELIAREVNMPLETIAKLGNLLNN